MELKFTLDEAFDIFYSNMLEEQISNELSELSSELDSDCLIESLSILTEKIEDGKEDTEKEKEKSDKDKERYNKDTDRSWNSAFSSALNAYDEMSKRAYENASRDIERRSIFAKLNAGGTYKPETSDVIVTPISKMKFPENIIFFITQLCKWIKNNIINIIDRLSSIVRTLLGLKVTDKQFTPEDLKLKMRKVEKIEGKYLVDTSDAYQDLTDKTANELNKFNGYSSSRPIVGSGLKSVMLMNVADNDIKLLGEDAIMPLSSGSVLTEAPDFDKNPAHSVKVITLDTSHDLMALKQSLQHFFDLFDNAFGSNDEKLFSIDDLTVMLELFKTTIDNLQHPVYDSAIEIRGSLYNDGAISASKLKDNLLRTRVNTDNLKDAYVVTNKQINAIAQIIANKNIMGISQMGVQYAMLSSATYEVMSEILTAINARLKEAETLEKKLEKMKTAYAKLVTNLESKRTMINSVSNFSWTTALQRSFNDLYDGARYMSQTVQLRLNTLALYISELNDTRAIIKNLNAINIANGMGDKKGFFSKLKSAFAK